MLGFGSCLLFENYFVAWLHVVDFVEDLRNLQEVAEMTSGFFKKKKVSFGFYHGDFILKCLLSGSFETCGFQSVEDEQKELNAVLRSVEEDMGGAPRTEMKAFIRTDIVNANKSGKQLFSFLLWVMNERQKRQKSAKMLTRGMNDIFFCSWRWISGLLQAGGLGPSSGRDECVWQAIDVRFIILWELEIEFIQPTALN